MEEKERTVQITTHVMMECGSWVEQLPSQHVKLPMEPQTQQPQQQEASIILSKSWVTKIEIQILYRPGKTCSQIDLLNYISLQGEISCCSS